MHTTAAYLQTRSLLNYLRNLGEREEHYPFLKSNHLHNFGEPKQIQRKNHKDLSLESIIDFNFKRVCRSNDDTTSLVFSTTNLLNNDSLTLQGKYVVVYEFESKLYS